MTHVPTNLIITRFGIGVFDPRWWQARLALFEAITLPSLESAMPRDFEWVLLLDQDLPDEILRWLRASVRNTKIAPRIRFEFVPSHVYMNDGVRNILRQYSDADERMIVMMIDDDDAIADDFFAPMKNLVEDNPHTSKLVTYSSGLALDGPRRNVAPLHRGNLLCGTCFYGTPAELHKLLMSSHTKWAKTASVMGFEVHEVSDQNKPGFVYTYHGQGDGDYNARVDSLVGWKRIGEFERKRFGVDELGLNRWMEVQDVTPPTLGLTWRRTQPEQYELHKLKLQMREVKRRTIETNSDLFNRKNPFLYMVYPLPNSSRPKGRIAFKGVATPGQKVRLSAAGTKGKYVELGRAISNPDNGLFGIGANFGKAKWNIRVELLGPAEDVVRRFEYTINVTD